MYSLRHRTCRTLVSMDQAVSIDFGSKHARPPSERAYRSVPVATRREVPSPASVTARKRNVSASAAVSSLGPHVACSRAAPGALCAECRCCSNARAWGGWRPWWIGGASGWWSTHKPSSQRAASSPLLSSPSDAPAACSCRRAQLVLCRLKMKPGRNCPKQNGHRTRPLRKGSMGILYSKCFCLQQYRLPPGKPLVQNAHFGLASKRISSCRLRGCVRAKRRYNFF